MVWTCYKYIVAPTVDYVSNERGAPKRTKDQLGLDQIGLPRIRDRSAMPNRC